MDNAEIEKLEEFEENRKHEIPPCDLESGDYSGYRECHVHPDFLLVYKVVDSQLQLYLYRTGTHSDLFG